MGWRRRLFRAVFLAIALWVGAVLAAAVGGIALFFAQSWGQWCLLGAGLAALLGLVALQCWVPRIARQRPRLEDQKLCVLA